MRFLALDLGTKTGWAWRSDSGKIESGVEVFDVRRGESRGLRYLRFRNWLEEMIRLVKPACISYEQFHMRGGAATEVAAGFATRVQEVAGIHTLEYVAVHSATIKKSATGKGNAKKPDMIEAAIKKWPELGEAGDPDDNEVDARWLLEYTEKFYGDKKC